MIRNGTESEVKFSVGNLRSEFAGSGSIHSLRTFLMSVAVEPVPVDDTLVLRQPKFPGDRLLIS